MHHILLVSVFSPHCFRPLKHAYFPLGANRVFTCGVETHTPSCLLVKDASENEL